MVATFSIFRGYVDRSAGYVRIMTHMNHEEIMKRAMEEAELAVSEGNAPFACVVVDNEGNIVLKEHDRVKELTDPLAHGEVNAIRKLCRDRNTLSLSDLTFYTTSEPCPTCMSSMIRAKVSQVFYGAKTEANATLPIPAEYLAEHSKRPIGITSGIMANECLEQRTQLLKSL